MSFDIQATHASLKTFLTTPKPRFVVFTSTWCPDCIRGVPPLKAAIEAAGVPLLAIDVGDLPGWKSPNHPLRVDPALRVTSIPTLIEYAEAGPGPTRLAKELEVASPEEIIGLVTDFIAGAQQRSK